MNKPTGVKHVWEVWYSLGGDSMYAAILLLIKYSIANRIKYQHKLMVEYDSSPYNFTLERIWATRAIIWMVNEL